MRNKAPEYDSPGKSETNGHSKLNCTGYYYYNLDKPACDNWG